MQLGFLRFLALLFLLPGLAALVANASLSTHYFGTMPRTPAPEENRVVRRALNGQVVYLTLDEDSQLDFLRYYGARAFAIGLGVGLLYLGLMATQLEQFHSTDLDDMEDEESRAREYR
jgi:hypothetical protein